MTQITITEALDRIGLTKETGEVFGVRFIKRTTGEERAMACRYGVRRGVKGTGLAFNPADKDLLCVFDMGKKPTTEAELQGAFRMIAVEGIFELSMRGEKFDVFHPKE